MRSWDLVEHARLPDVLRSPARTDWGRRNRGDDTIHSWLEGPLLEESGSLLFVDVAHGRILRAAPNGGIDVVHSYEGSPNGLAFHDGGVVIADGSEGLLRLDLYTPTPSLETLLGEWEGGPFLGLNDLIVDGEGAIFVTDQGMTGLHDPSGRVLHLGPSGASVVLSGIPSPNGIASRPGSSELLVAVTRDNSVWRVPLGDGLVPYRVGRFIQMSGGVGPDGLAVRGDGSLFVAHLGMGVVWAYDPVGRLLGGFETPDGLNPTNVCYSPDDLIYVTEADTGAIFVGDVGDAVGAM